MERVDRFLVRHRRSVLVAWTLAVLAAVPFSMHHAPHNPDPLSRLG